MIVDLPSTSTAAIGKQLVQLRNEVGALALGRVLTLIVVVDDDAADEAVEIATEASRQHPCRIIVVISGSRRGANRIDGQIRVGGDAGASEVVIMRLFGKLAEHGQSVVTPLLLPDSPVVAWWPREAPSDLRHDPIAAMATRRVTDSAECSHPRAMLTRLAETYQPGDTDLSWTRITLWRGLLAAALDGPPYESVTAATVAGAPDSPSTDLLAAWLAWALRVPVTREDTQAGSGICAVGLERASGAIDLARPGDLVATMTQPGQPDRRISLRRRGDAECLADELRRLDADETYADVLRKGLPALGTTRGASRSAAVSESKREAERERRNHAAQLRTAAAEAGSLPSTVDTTTPAKASGSTPTKPRVTRSTSATARTGRTTKEQPS
ncbi:MAG TPA: glucose-6-phosphate dehydrogenase assembly protein OpcA [Dermatophilaceae bacterium]|nr:MAG: Glucose-6-phosphate dehydrogenase subunit [bacterium ADurb.BinA028]HNV13334.1 glucose-6-phosphate dehydrogenase assembly protein OpcA [Dermatophilaceae bacterium]HOA01975.1 glucose-6-phosphate dehydrogenase assembly protein OpcA [Dermatophilaceae bacterium]HOA56675.1 glucose-6-phosphate dehydrogenase assembly protein OpcA [Dermatophilaceae bacterium]HOF37018.1 glucose-6-phosphate dehydrogenase assembly protein OpcA [Dermatophilaceae bacterium]